MKTLTPTKVKFSESLPSLREIKKAAGAEHLVLVIDERLTHLSSMQKWQLEFPQRMVVRAGENLKDIQEFPRHVRQVLPLLSGRGAHETAIVAVGGGSVGDFAGFLASVLKRGTKFVNVPSTWLAAMDSAHGGKTGLNVDDYKNQVGTFYPAQAVFCVRDILDLQPHENVRSAYGEALKMALIEGGPLYSKFSKLKELNDENLWKLLPSLVAAKMKVVKLDPFETKGVRQKLNLGHTLGHAYEVEKQLAHGLAVQVGLEFTTEWSFRQKRLKNKDYEAIKALLSKNRMGPLSPIPAERLRQRVQQDKKSTHGEEVRYVFIQKPGTVAVEKVKISDLVQAARDLGWAQ